MRLSDGLPTSKVTLRLAEAACGETNDCVCLLVYRLF